MLLWLILEIVRFHQLQLRHFYGRVITDIVTAWSSCGEVLSDLDDDRVLPFVICFFSYYGSSSSAA